MIYTTLLLLYAVCVSVTCWFFLGKGIISLLGLRTIRLQKGIQWGYVLAGVFFGIVFGIYTTQFMPLVEGMFGSTYAYGPAMGKFVFLHACFTAFLAVCFSLLIGRMTLTFLGNHNERWKQKVLMSGFVVSLMNALIVVLPVVFIGL